MRIRAIAISLSCALCSISCVQRWEASETERVGNSTPATLHTADESDFPGDPDIGIGFGSEPPSGGVGSAPDSSSGGAEESPTGNFSHLALCLFLARARPAVKEAFCRSQSDPTIRAQCWAKTRTSPIEWTNWCHEAFPL
jgi:hypothetical protein